MKKLVKENLNEVKSSKKTSVTIKLPADKVNLIKKTYELSDEWFARLLGNYVTEVSLRFDPYEGSDFERFIDDEGFDKSDDDREFFVNN